MNNGTIIFGIVAAWFLWRFYSAYENGWYMKSGWWPRSIYQKDEPRRFALGQAGNLLGAIAAGGIAILSAFQQ